MPSVIAKLIFGQMANELLLNGQNIYPKKALDFGYKFKFDKVDEAIPEAVL
jgi:NAD dependent epimerase/dehydratase family enzyme